MKKGIFCISLDFEKYWGVHDVRSVEETSHFEGIKSVVERLLNQFDQYDIHVTWATVGLLGHASLTELEQANNGQAIPYANAGYSPFPITGQEYASLTEEMALARQEISAILAQPNQELASHTYSHFYCSETGPTRKDFEKDCKAMTAIGATFNTAFTSIVFPRNQVDEVCLNTCNVNGYKAYRGNQPNRFWSNSQYASESPLKKLGRYMDAYFPLSRTTRFKIGELEENEGLINIPASRFFRPFSGRTWLEKRKIKRIKNEMYKAARNGEIYHLWWHPHNFLLNTDACLKQLEELFAYYHVLQSKFGMESYNMSEIARYVKA